MSYELEKFTLNGSSNIEINFYLGTSEKLKYSKVTVIKYSGTFGIGCEGNGDAVYMYAMGIAAVSLHNSAGVIIDWTDLDYQWGDMLEMVLDIGSRSYIDGEFPRAVVVGPKCKEAVRTLLLGLESKESIEKLGFVFENLDSAFKYMEDEVNKNKSFT